MIALCVGCFSLGIIASVGYVRVKTYLKTRRFIRLCKERLDEYFKIGIDPWGE